MSTNYYLLEPNVAGVVTSDSIGDSGVQPNRIERLVFEVWEWVGDDIASDLGVVLVTSRLRKALEELPATGCVFDSVEVRKHPEYYRLKALDPAYYFTGLEDVPELHWLRITGAAGIDDFGLPLADSNAELVVSERVLDVLKSLTLSRCAISKFAC